MRSFLYILLAVGLLVGVAIATVAFGSLVSTLGLFFLVMASIVGLVVAAAGNKVSISDISFVEASFTEDVNLSTEKHVSDEANISEDVTLTEDASLAPKKLTHIVAE